MRAASRALTFLSAGALAAVLLPFARRAPAADKPARAEGLSRSVAFKPRSICR